MTVATQSSATPGAWLRDYSWQSAYGPQDNPLESFYIPALSRAVRYDRIAGFFSSSALSAAAQGVASLVARGGRMRLLVGAQLSPQDVDAILHGISLQDRLADTFLQVLRDPVALSNALVKERLKALAWLVAHGQLDIRVVVEADPYTAQPLASGGYFHAKSGILWDEAGDGIAFVGSINETATAWRHNYERFHVFCSWREVEHFQQEAETFERLWKNAEAGWLTVDLPEAVQHELVKLAPTEPPTEEPALQQIAQADAQARWIAQYIRDAPYIVHGGWRVGVETAALAPFPHQRAVACDILEKFPCRRLLADEVGLGKTIEAGLILRSLLLSGWVKRCLILVPRSLAKQWQEELRDRFLVDAPFYDGSRFLYFQHPDNRYESVPPDKSPWEVHPVTIASAQMVKRRDRAASLLAAAPWDLVILDEAHHARRRDFQDMDDYRKNRLLELMEQLRERTRALLLLTATPMQVHPIEVWDLLRLLGLPRAWQDPHAFLDYFQALRLPFEGIAWETVLPLLREAVKTWGWKRSWEQAARQALGTVGLHRLKSAISGTRQDALGLSVEQRRWMLEALRKHHPVEQLAYRYTRDLLREYYRRGLITQHVPDRRPRPVWLEMSEEEERLYEDVEKYISTYYNLYEEVRRGLGFIMTIYRRRLTSSLYALQRSLQRRRLFLLGQWRDEEHPQGLDDEDLEEADLDLDASEELTEYPAFRDAELREIDGLLEKLGRLSHEAKFSQVQQDLRDALERWDQVLVFTQYTDTLDFLRGELRPAFGNTLGCYSGRGGEVWDNTAQTWVGTSKERIQREFADGGIKVLICTDAAAEGLNLQNCGVVFNYDMPWNPMKVEQRIGRVDRIGQRRPEIVVRHYFYKRTVEAQVYQALGERIDWFQTVVGELQPILLQHTQRTIERAAMALGEEREQVVREGIARLEQEYQAAQHSASVVSHWRPDSDPPPAQAPVTLDDLGKVISQRSPWREQLSPGPGDGILLINTSGKTSEITFDPELLNHAPPDTKATVCTYGTEVFSSLVSLPPPPSRPDIVRLVREGERRQIGYYGWNGRGWEPITDLEDLCRRLERPGPKGRLDYTAPQRQFEQDVKP